MWRTLEISYIKYNAHCSRHSSNKLLWCVSLNLRFRDSETREWNLVQMAHHLYFSDMCLHSPGRILSTEGVYCLLVTEPNPDSAYVWRRSAQCVSHRDSQAEAPTHLCRVTACPSLPQVSVCTRIVLMVLNFPQRYRLRRMTTEKTDWTHNHDPYRRCTTIVMILKEKFRNSCLSWFVRNPYGPLSVFVLF